MPSGPEELSSVGAGCRHLLRETAHDSTSQPFLALQGEGCQAHIREDLLNVGPIRYCNAGPCFDCVSSQWSSLTKQSEFHIQVQPHSSSTSRINVGMSRGRGGSAEDNHLFAMFHLSNSADLVNHLLWDILLSHLPACHRVRRVTFYSLIDIHASRLEMKTSGG